jgi:hypothetical protein
MPENEIRVWAVIDANGHPLHSSNDRDAVVADYEERIAKDARLRRVLRIEERTLQFHPRDEPLPDPGEPQTICVLPWLPLDEPIRMGPLIFDEWSEIRQLVDEPARTSADRLLANFFDVRGAPIDPVVCFYDGPLAERAPGVCRSRPRSNPLLSADAGRYRRKQLHAPRLRATDCRPRPADLRELRGRSGSDPGCPPSPRRLGTVALANAAIVLS